MANELLNNQKTYTKLNQQTEEELLEVAKRYARQDWLTVSRVVWELAPDTEEQDIIDALIAEKLAVLKAKAARQAKF